MGNRVIAPDEQEWETRQTFVVLAGTFSISLRDQLPSAV
jgi:hypothetical protein